MAYSWGRRLLAGSCLQSNKLWKEYTWQRQTKAGWKPAIPGGTIARSAAIEYLCYADRGSVRGSMAP